MTIKLTRITNILLLVVGMFIAPQVLAIDITKIDPVKGEQGTNGLDVEIYGNGFDEYAEVTFLLGKKQAPGITVTHTNREEADKGKIVATIDIAETAELGNYTLKVSLRRGGKGTTATATFEVVQGNKMVSYCDQVFDGVAYPTECDCKFTSKVDGGEGKPNNLIWILQNDCSTSKTLKLGQYETLNGNGKTLTAIPPAKATPPPEDYEKFRSVITNSGHRAQVFFLNILVQDDVYTGCATDGTVLNSAISFVLDGTKEHPEETPDFKEPREEADTYPTTWLRAWDIIVTSANPLCRAIELRREISYDTTVLGGSADYPDLVANVRNVWITSGSPSGAGSYSDAGIQVSGFVNSGLGGRSGEKISILFSTVEGAVAESTGSAIRFGPVDGEGTVGQNVISANGDGEFGISVEGGGMDDVTIENNTVVGAQTAISVDDQVVNAYFKSNVLTGDGLEGDPEGDPDIDIGLDTCAWNNRYRSNAINDFDTALQEGSCSLP